MIVRNEAHVIERCLASVRPLISTWLIVDTGSTDDTERVARAALSGLPGDYLRRPWRDFAHNRTECLELARGRGDYTLVIDADDALEIDPDVLPLRLDADAYQLPVHHGEIVYQRAHFLRSALPWRYEGVVHEWAACDVAAPAQPLQGVRYLFLGGGARSRDPKKYRRDAELLEQALISAPNDSRSVFYLAQSYRDAGLATNALAAYRRRAAMGGWEEEVWYSLHEAARLERDLAHDEEVVVAAFLRAHEARPIRAESLYELAHYARVRRRFQSAYLFAKTAASLPPPSDQLFVNLAVYRWRALDEWAISAYYVGRDDEAIAANDRLLDEGLLPPTEVARVRDNREFSRARRGQPQ